MTAEERGLKRGLSHGLVTAKPVTRKALRVCDGCRKRAAKPRQCKETSVTRKCDGSVTGTVTGTKRAYRHAVTRPLGRDSVTGPDPNEKQDFQGWRQREKSRSRITPNISTPRVREYRHGLDPRKARSSPSTLAKVRHG